MSPMVRWILAIVMAGILISCVAGLGTFSLMAMAFSTDSCGSLPDGMAEIFIILPPSVMILGSLAGAVLFGLNKKWQWWLGAIAAGGLLGMLGYAAWFIILPSMC